MVNPGPPPFDPPSPRVGALPADLRSHPRRRTAGMLSRGEPRAAAITTDGLRSPWGSSDQVISMGEKTEDFSSDYFQ